MARAASSIYPGPTAQTVVWRRFVETFGTTGLNTFLGKCCFYNSMGQGKNISGTRYSIGNGTFTFVKMKEFDVNRCRGIIPVYGQYRIISITYHFNTSILCNLEEILICRDNRTGMMKKRNPCDENIKRMLPVSCCCHPCPDTACYLRSREIEFQDINIREKMP